MFLPTAVGGASIEWVKKLFYMVLICLLCGADMFLMFVLDFLLRRQYWLSKGSNLILDGTRKTFLTFKTSFQIGTLPTTLD